jgi:hypothetical protein
MPEKKPKVVILFGAGASFGSKGMKTPPPLGNMSLFYDLIEKSVTWRRLLDDHPNCVEKFKPGFEHGMDYVIDLQASGKISYLYDLLKEMAIALLDYHIEKPANNQYWKLCKRYFKELKENELQFATLNYDCLIEEAILLIKPDSPINYWGGQEGIRLLKPHGSCNFVLHGATGGGKIVFQNLDQLIGSLEAIHPSLAKEKIMDSGGAPPGMCIYNTTKTNSFVNNEIEIIRNELQDSLRGANLIIVVGVNPRLKGDDHVWANIRNSHGKVGIVDTTDKCQEWRNKFRKGKNDPILKETFMLAYKGICEEIDRYL